MSPLLRTSLRCLLVTTLLLSCSLEDQGQRVQSGHGVTPPWCTLTTGGCSTVGFTMEGKLPGKQNCREFFGSPNKFICVQIKHDSLHPTQPESENKYIAYDVSKVYKDKVEFQPFDYPWGLNLTDSEFKIKIFYPQVDANMRNHDEVCNDPSIINYLPFIDGYVWGYGTSVDKPLAFKLTLGHPITATQVNLKEDKAGMAMSVRSKYSPAAGDRDWIAEAGTTSKTPPELVYDRTAIRQDVYFEKPACLPDKWPITLAVKKNPKEYLDWYTYDAITDTCTPLASNAHKATYEIADLWQSTPHLRQLCVKRYDGVCQDGSDARFRPICFTKSGTLSASCDATCSVDERTRKSSYQCQAHGTILSVDVKAQDAKGENFRIVASAGCDVAQDGTISAAGSAMSCDVTINVPDAILPAAPFAASVALKGLHDPRSRLPPLPPLCGIPGTRDCPPGPTLQIGGEDPTPLTNVQPAEFYVYGYASPGKADTANPLCSGATLVLSISQLGTGTISIEELTFTGSN